MKRRFIILFAILTMLFACQESVVLDLGDAESRLVIEGVISNDTIPAVVKLSYTQSFYDTAQGSLVQNARVSIIHPNGMSTILNDGGNGLFYSNDIELIPGNKYKLNVELDGELIEAETELLVPAKIVSRLEVSNPFFGADSINIYTYLEDVKDVESHYRLKVNNISDVWTDDYYIFDDAFGVNDTIQMPVYYKNFEIGDTVVIEVYHISKQMYNYYIGLSENIGGSFNSVSPGNPVSNLPDNVMGYFAGFGIDRDTIIVGDPLFSF